MNSLRPIVIVEDSLADMELMLESIKGHHLANPIDTCRDGAEALDYLYRRGLWAARGGLEPIVVFLDLKMPKVDGMEVLRIVKSDPKLKTIPVVILTSSHEESDLVKSYKLGANAYVVKPVGFAEFAAAVEELGAFWAVLNEPPPL